MTVTVTRNAGYSGGVNVCPSAAVLASAASARAASASVLKDGQSSEQFTSSAVGCIDLIITTLQILFGLF